MTNIVSIIIDKLLKIALTLEYNLNIISIVKGLVIINDKKRELFITNSSIY